VRTLAETLAGDAVQRQSPGTLTRQPSSNSFHHVPGRQVSLMNDELDITTSAAVLSKAGAIAGRHLTRQNTGNFEGSKIFEHAVEVQRKQRSRRARAAGRKPRFVVDPRTSRLLPYWDGLLVLLVLFTAFVTPFEVSFLPIATSPLDVLWLLNRVIDVVFILDMLVNFRLVFATGGEGDEGIVFVEEPAAIAKAYLSSWFTVDLISIATSTVDIYAVSLGAGSAESIGTLGNLRGLRALRALRLIKMVSLLRTSRVFKSLETRTALDHRTGDTLPHVPSHYAAVACR